jgi:uncharacterized protein
LGAFLTSDAVQSGLRLRFGLQALHGYLTAVVCTPDMILPSEWLPVILGDSVYDTLEQAQRVNTLILRFYNDVATALRADTPFVPLITAPPSGSGDTEAGEQLWCHGFIAGMALRGNQWRIADGDDELVGSLLPILTLGGTSSENPLRIYRATSHDELASMLPEAIATLYARMQRRTMPDTQTYHTHASEDRQLPSYDYAALTTWTVSELLEQMIKDEDRVPRNVIDELVRRGKDTLSSLQARTERGDFWSSPVSSGEWWLRLHVVMVLGLLPGEEAGQLLVRLMRRMSEAEDEDLQGWLGGYWPALFRNKPASMAVPLRVLAMDRSLDWYIRSYATETAVAIAARTDAEELDVALSWLARLVADEAEDWTLRLCAASSLLDFPRAAHRPLLEALAARQKKPDVHFAREDIEQAYAMAEDNPGWRRFDDPWRFYTPDAIAARQARWTKEDAEWEQRRAGGNEMYLDDEALPTYIRSDPKIGRNDPCPCGSGKKFKKCHGVPDAGPMLH